MVRSKAISALVKLQARSTIPALVERLSDTDVIVQLRALKALGMFKAVEAVPQVVAFFRAENDVLVAVAAETAGRIGSKDSIPGLTRLLSDRECYVREAAAKALCRLGSDKGVPALFRLYQSTDELFPLNALRHPKLWNRLRSVRVDLKQDVPVRKVLVQVAKQAGVELTFGPLPYADDKEHPEYELVREDAGPTTALDAIEIFVPWIWGESQGLYGIASVIFEPGRIRVVESGKARDFWLEWWRARHKR